MRSNRAQGAALAVATAALLFGGCAKEGMPPGGPVDRTPPEVVRLVPEPESTGVDLEQTIVLAFSEPMDRPSVERALFFTPDIGPTLHPRWLGNELHLVPRVPLRENTTFVITLGADAADRHRNRMGESVTLAFSTGPTLDNAALSGRVLRENGQPAGGSWIWLYAVDDPRQREWADPALAMTDDPPSVPLYVSQADNAGLFSLTHLAQGTYRTYAYLDLDGRRGFNPERDLLAVPPVDVVLDRPDINLSQLVLAVAPRDTLGPVLRTVAPAGRSLLYLRFAKAVVPDPAPRVVIDPLDSEGKPDPRSPRPSITRAYQPFDNPLVWVVQAEGLQPEHRYEVRVVEAWGERGQPGSPAPAPPSFQVPAPPDTLRPRVLTVTPADSSRGLHADRWVRLLMATEIDSAGLGAWHFAGPDTIEAERRWLDPRTLELRPRGAPRVDAWYRLEIPAEGLRAWNGLTGPPETYTVTWQGVAPPGRGTLRLELEGPELEPPARYRIILRGAGMGTPAETEWTATGPGRIVTPELPVGPYRLWGWADLDNDGRWDPGRVRPFRPAEPMGSIGDTLWVRDTFESVVPLPLYLGPPIESDRIPSPQHRPAPAKGYE